METFNNLLIEAVRVNEHLYDREHALFRDKEAKEKAWSVIADLTGKRKEDCRRKWVVLRERYTKELKKREAPSGSGAGYADDWHLFENLGFLKKFIRPRRSRVSTNTKDYNTDYNISTITKEDAAIESDIESIETAMVEEFLNEPTPCKPPKTESTNFEDACKEVKLAAKAIQLKHTTDSIRRTEINENFAKTCLGLLSDLRPSTQDYAFNQIMNFIIQLRRDELFPTTNESSDDYPVIKIE